MMRTRLTPQKAGTPVAILLISAIFGIQKLDQRLMGIVLVSLRHHRLKIFKLTVT